MTDGQLRIIPLDAADTRAFAQLKQLYRNAIVRSEQKSLAELDAMLSCERYIVLAAEAAGRVVGFAIVYVPENLAFGLVEYMAVDPGERSRGLGAKLFEAAVAALRGRAPAAPCLLEVDRLPAGDPATSDASRRLRFYDRLGCKRVAGLAYLLPLDGHGTPPPMYLLVLTPVETDWVLREKVATWLRTLYADVYARPPGDGRVDMMLSSLDPIVRLAPIWGDDT